MELALSVLEKMEIAILRRLAPLRYELFGKVPQFYRQMFCDGNTLCLDPWNKSSMLDFFITDAETLFATGGEGHITSGIWREDGMHEHRALQASAFLINNTPLLIVRCLDEEYLERVKILQKAREHLLEHRVLNLTLEKYKRMACYDSLTGLLNRATFMENMQGELRQTEARRGVFSLLLLDVDDFKQVNDTYGHLAGDAVLSATGDLLNQRLRRGDIAARYGGEEFIIFAPNTNKAKVGLMAENLRCFIEDHDFGLPRKITVSIGCSSYHQGEELKSLFSRADKALYEAKRKSKNTVVVS